MRDFILKIVVGVATMAASAAYLASLRVDPVTHAQAPQADKLSFVYFEASWCRPCRIMRATTLADRAVRGEMKLRFGDKITFLDVDEPSRFVQDCKITAVPTWIVFRGDKEVSRASGLMGPVQFLKWLKAVPNG